MRSASGSSHQHLGADLPRIGDIEPASPTTSADEEDDGAVLVIAPHAAAERDAAERARTTKLNRASTVSIMSGLEAPDWARNYYSGGENALDTASDTAASSVSTSAAQSADTPLYARGHTYVPPKRTSSRRTAPSAAAQVAAAASQPAQAASPPKLPPRGPPAPSIASEERQGLLPESTRKLRNFFGQRPPSELITTHLTEFFPLGLRGSGMDKVDRKLLSKQVRASIRRSMSAATGGALLPPGVDATGRRSSTASIASRTSRHSSLRPRTSGASGLEPFPRTASPVSHGETSWEQQRDARPQVAESASMSRFSGSSNGSVSDLPLASTGSSLRGTRSPRSSSGSALDPPDETAEDDGVADAAQTHLVVPARVAASPESVAMAMRHSSSSSAGETTTSAGENDLAETRSLASSLAPSYLDPHGLSSNRLSRRMSRMSGSSRLSVGAQSLWERRSRDSDVASIITVDDVTAELETRRQSGVSWRNSDEDDAEEDLSVYGRDDDAITQVTAADDAHGVGSDFDDEMSDDEDFDDDDDDEEDPEDEPGTAKPEGTSPVEPASLRALTHAMRGTQSRE